MPKIVRPSKPPAPVAAKVVEFKMRPVGAVEVGGGQHWEAVVREEGQAIPDAFPAAVVYTFSGNAAAQLIDMMRVAVRAELDARGLGGRRIPKKR